MANTLNIPTLADVPSTSDVPAETPSLGALGLAWRADNPITSPTVQGDVASLVDPRKVYMAYDAGVTDGLNEYEKDFATKSLQENVAKYGKQAYGIENSIRSAAAGDFAQSQVDRSVGETVADTAIALTSGLAEGTLDLADTFNKYLTPWAGIDALTGSHVTSTVTGILNKAKQGIQSLAEQGYSDEVKRDNIIAGYKNALDEATHEREYQEALANGESPFTAWVSKFAKDIGSGAANAISTPTGWTQAPAELLGSIGAMALGDKGLSLLAKGAKGATTIASKLAPKAETALTKAASATAKAGETAGVDASRAASATTTAASGAATAAEATAARTAAVGTAEAAANTAEEGAGWLAKFRDLTREPLQVGAQEGGSAGMDAYNDVMEMSDAELTESSEMYRKAKEEYLAQGLSEKEAEAKAKEDVAYSATYKANAYTGGIAALSGKLMPEGLLKNPLKGFFSPANVLKNSGREGGQEFFEGAGAFGTNIAAQETYDNNRKTDEGVGTGMGESLVTATVGTAEMGAPRAALRGLHKTISKGSEKLFGESDGRSLSERFSSNQKFTANIKTIHNNKGVLNEALNSARNKVNATAAEVNATEATEAPNTAEGTTNTENATPQVDPVAQSAADTLEHMTTFDTAAFDDQEEVDYINETLGLNEKNGAIKKGDNKFNTLNNITAKISSEMQKAVKSGDTADAERCLYLAGVAQYLHDNLFGTNDIKAVLQDITDEDQKKAITEAYDSYNNLANNSKYTTIIDAANKLADRLITQNADLANNTTMSEEDKQKAYDATIHAYAMKLGHTLMSSEQLEQAKKITEAAINAGINHVGGIETTSFLDALNKQIANNNALDKIDEARLRELVKVARAEGKNFTEEDIQKLLKDKSSTGVQFQKLYDTTGASTDRRSLEGYRKRILSAMQAGKAGEAWEAMVQYHHFLQSQINKLNAYKKSHIERAKKVAHSPKGTKVEAERQKYTSYNPTLKTFYDNQEGIYAGNPALGAAMAIEEEALVTEYNYLKEKFFKNHSNAGDLALTGYHDPSLISNEKLVSYHTSWKAYQRQQKAQETEDNLYVSDNDTSSKKTKDNTSTNPSSDTTGNTSQQTSSAAAEITEEDFIRAKYEALQGEKGEDLIVHGSKRKTRLWQIPEVRPLGSYADGVAIDVEGMHHLRRFGDSERTTPKSRHYAVVGTLNKDTKNKDTETKPSTTLGKVFTTLANDKIIVRTAKSGKADESIEGLAESKAKEDKFRRGIRRGHLNTIYRPEHVANAKTISEHVFNQENKQESDKQRDIVTTMQILGLNVDSPVDFVVCYCPKDENGNITGEGKEAIELAQKLNIPVFNFADNPEKTAKDFEAFYKEYNKEKDAQDELKEQVQGTLEKALDDLARDAISSASLAEYRKALPVILKKFWEKNIRNRALPRDEIEDIIKEINNIILNPITEEKTLSQVTDAFEKAFDTLNRNTQLAYQKKVAYDEANTLTSKKADKLLQEAGKEFNLSQQQVEALAPKFYQFKLDSADPNNLKGSSLVTSLLSGQNLSADLQTKLGEFLQKKLWAMSPKRQDELAKKKAKEDKEALQKLNAEEKNTRFEKVKQRLYGLDKSKFKTLDDLIGEQGELTKLADPNYPRKPGELSAVDAAKLKAQLTEGGESLFTKVNDALTKLCSASEGNKFYRKEVESTDKGYTSGNAPYFTPTENSVFYKEQIKEFNQEKQKTDAEGTPQYKDSEVDDSTPIPETEKVKQKGEVRVIRLSYADVLKVLNDKEKASQVSAEEFNRLCQIFPTLMLMQYNDEGKLVPNKDIVANMAINAIAMFNTQKEGSGYTWDRFADTIHMPVGQIQRIQAKRTDKNDPNHGAYISGAQFLQELSAGIMLAPLFNGLKRNLRKSMNIHYNDNMLYVAACRSEAILASSLIQAMIDANLVTKHICNIKGNEINLYAIKDKESSILSTITSPDALNRMLGNDNAADEGEITAVGKEITKSTDTNYLHSNRKLPKKAVEARDNYEKTEFRIDTGMMTLYKSLHKNDSKDMLELYGEPITDRMDHLDRLSKESSNGLITNSWSKISRWEQEMQRMADQIDGVEAGKGDISHVTKHFRFGITDVNRIQELESYGPTANKQTREVLLSTWNTVDISDTNNKDWRELSAAVIQNMGGKLNQHNADVAVKAFTALEQAIRSSIKDNPEQFKHVLKLVRDPNNVSAKDVIAAQNEIKAFMETSQEFTDLGLKKVDQNFMSLHAMQTLAQVVLAKEAGKSSFRCSLYVECDGTTNGSIFGKFLFTNKIVSGDTTYTLATDYIRNGDMGNLRLGDPYGGTAGSVKEGKILEHDGKTEKPKDLYEKSAQLALEKIKANKAKLTSNAEDGSRVMLADNEQREIYKKYLGTSIDGNPKYVNYDVKRGSKKEFGVVDSTISDSWTIVRYPEKEMSTDLVWSINGQDPQPHIMSVTKMFEHVSSLCRLSGATVDVNTSLEEAISRSFMKSPDTKGGYFAGAESIINSFLYGDRNNDGVFKALAEFRTKVLQKEAAVAKAEHKNRPLTRREIAEAMFGDKFSDPLAQDKALTQYLGALNALTHNHFVTERDDDGNITSIWVEPTYVPRTSNHFNTNKREVDGTTYYVYSNFTEKSFTSAMDEDGASFDARIEGNRQHNDNVASIDLSAENMENIYRAVKTVYGDAIVEAVNETLKGEGIEQTQDTMLRISATSSAMLSAMQCAEISNIDEGTLTVGQYRKKFQQTNSKRNSFSNVIHYDNFDCTLGNTDEKSKSELAGGSILSKEDFGRATKTVSNSYINWGEELNSLAQIHYEVTTPSHVRAMAVSTIGCGDGNMMQDSMGENSYSAEINKKYSSSNQWDPYAPTDIFDGQNQQVGRVADGGYAINHTMSDTAIQQNPMEGIVGLAAQQRESYNYQTQQQVADERGVLQDINTEEEVQESAIYRASEEFADMMSFLNFEGTEKEVTDANGDTKTVKTAWEKRTIKNCWDTQVANLVALYAPLEVTKTEQLKDANGNIGTFSKASLTNARNKAVRLFVEGKKRELAGDNTKNLRYVHCPYTSSDFIHNSFDPANLRDKAQDFFMEKFLAKNDVEGYLKKLSQPTVDDKRSEDQREKDAKDARNIRTALNNNIIPPRLLKHFAKYFGVNADNFKKKDKTFDNDAFEKALNKAYVRMQIAEYRDALSVFLGSYSTEIGTNGETTLVYTPMIWGAKEFKQKDALSLFDTTTKNNVEDATRLAADIAYIHAADWLMGFTCDHMASSENPYVLDPLDPAKDGGEQNFIKMLTKAHLLKNDDNKTLHEIWEEYLQSDARKTLTDIQRKFTNSRDFINTLEMLSFTDKNGNTYQLTMDQTRGMVLEGLVNFIKENFHHDISEISAEANRLAKETQERTKQLNTEMKRCVDTTTVAEYLGNTKDMYAVNNVLSEFSEAFASGQHPSSSTKIKIVSGYESNTKTALGARIESREVLLAVYIADMAAKKHEPNHAVVDHLTRKALIDADNAEGMKTNSRQFTPIQFYEPVTDTIYLLSPNPTGTLDKKQSEQRHKIILPHEIMHSLADGIITHFEDTDYAKYHNRAGNKSWYSKLSPMKKAAYGALDRLHALKHEIDSLSDEVLDELSKENAAIKFYKDNRNTYSPGQEMTEFIATFGTMSEKQLMALTNAVKASNSAKLAYLNRETAKELTLFGKLVSAIKNAYAAFIKAIFKGDDNYVQNIIHGNLAILKAANAELSLNDSATNQSILASANATPSFLDITQDPGRDSSETVDAETATVENNSRPVDTLSSIDKLANNLIRTLLDAADKLKESAQNEQSSDRSIHEHAESKHDFLRKRLLPALAEGRQIHDMSNVINNVITPLQNLGFLVGNRESFAKVVSSFELVNGLKSPIYTDISLAVRKILDTISPETFCSNPNDSTQLSRGLAITNFLQGIGKDSLNANQITPVFLALSQTDPTFRHILSEIKFPKRSTEGYLSVDKALNKALEQITEQLAASKGMKPTKTFADMFDNVILQMLKSENAMARATIADTLTDKVDDALSRTINSLATKAGEKIGIPTQNLASRVENEINSFNKVPHWVKEVQHDLIGCTEMNYEFYEANTRAKTATQQTRENARQQLPKATKARFKTKVSQETWNRLSKTIGKTSLASLFNGDIADVMSYTSSPTNIANNISKLAKQLDKYQVAKCKQLANYMVTGKAGKMLLRNPLAIAQRLGSSKINEEPSKELINACDKLTSLFALQALSEEERNEINDLCKNDAAAMKTLLGTAKNQYTQGMEKASGHERGKYNWYKGSVASDFKNGAHFNIAPLSKQKEMERFGYKLVRNYKGANLDSAELGVYYADFSQSNYLNPGAIQLTASTANGINLATGGSLVPNGGMIVKPEYVRAITAGMGNYYAHEGEDLMPIFDSKGRIVAYERTIDPKLVTDNQYLAPNQDYAELLGIQEGRNLEEKMIDNFNNEVVDVLSKQYLDGKKNGDGNYYVNLYDVKDPVVANLVKRIPQKLKDKIAQSFDGDGRFMVLPSEINDIIGYHSASITDSWTGESRLPPAVQNAFVAVCEKIMGKNAFKYLKKSENAIHDVVTSAKNMIIIRSVAVPAMNMFANMLQLYIEGVPVSVILQQTMHVSKELNSYVKFMNQKVQIQQELSGELTGYRKHQLEAQLKVINSGIEHLEIWPLLQHQEFSSIANLGDIGREFDFSNSTLGDKIIDKVDKLSNNTVLKCMTHYGFVTPDTSLYKFLEKTNQYGDFIGKAILYHDLTKRRGWSDRQAHKKVKDEFVDYVRLPGRGRDYMERMGLLWFYNFKLRMQKVAFANLKEHPLRSLALSAMGMPTPLTDSLFGKFPVMAYTMGPMSMLKSAFTSNPWVALLVLLF